MITCQVVIGVLIKLLFSGGGGGEALTGAIIAFICVYVSGFAWSWGPLAWLVPSEIAPLEIRAAATAINTAVSFFCFCCWPSYRSRVPPVPFRNNTLTPRSKTNNPVHSSTFCARSWSASALFPFCASCAKALFTSSPFGASVCRKHWVVGWSCWGGGGALVRHKLLGDPPRLRCQVPSRARRRSPQLFPHPLPRPPSLPLPPSLPPPK